MTFSYLTYYIAGCKNNTYFRNITFKFSYVFLSDLLALMAYKSGIVQKRLIYKI